MPCVDDSSESSESLCVEFQKDDGDDEAHNGNPKPSEGGRVIVQLRNLEQRVLVPPGVRDVERNLCSDGSHFRQYARLCKGTSSKPMCQ